MNCLAPRPKVHRWSFLLLSALGLLSVSCKISIVEQPSAIEAGNDVEFVFQVQNGLESEDQALLARVPLGWIVTSALYENSTAPPSSGSLDFASTAGFFCFDTDVPLGFQGLGFFRTPPVSTLEGDSVTIRIQFHIDSTPTLPYQTAFGVSGTDGAFATCSNIVESTWNGELIFKDGFEEGDLSQWSSNSSVSP